MKKLLSLFAPLLLVAGLIGALPRADRAQDQDQVQGQGQIQDPNQGQNQNQPDPPGRVARLNYMQGSVSFQPAGTKDWVDASPNRPLTTGDNLWADENSRGELHIGSTGLRLSAQTGISILNLNDQAVQIQLPQGSLDVRVRALADTEAYEIDTPNLALSLLRPGEYRIDVDPNGGSTIVTVRSGSGEVTTNQMPYSLAPGQQYAFTGTDQVSYDAHLVPGRDAFDDWCASRDQTEDHSVSARYVSREVTGSEDMDTYGQWSSDPEYGNVWYPSGVEVGWAPYHYGHWVYVAPWGWTWVESEPWGFAPFHYGRWALVSGRWGWCPGPAVAVGIGVRPYYAPALVGFVGGGGFSVSLAIGGRAGVAWFPLGPRDVWVPGYHASAVYVRNVNITNTRVVNVTQVNNVYINRSVTVNNYTYVHNTAAVTAVSRETFVNGAPVERASVHVNAADIQNPHVMQGAAPQPTLHSYVGPAAMARTAPPATLANRPVVTKMAPPAQARAFGHSQPLANERGGAPAGLGFNRNAGAPGQRPQFQPPSHGNTNGNSNPNGNPNSNGTRSNGTPGNNGGFQPFSRGNSNTNGNTPPSTGGQPPVHNNVNGGGNAPPNTTARPSGGFQPPEKNDNAKTPEVPTHANHPAPKPKQPEKKPEDHEHH